jgi:succinate-acetate transporter protein
LTPIAAPSILGLFGFMAATLIVAANLAGWYGTSASPLFLFPFATAAGGLAQFIAGMWAYKARDGLATAMHGIWGSFWIGYGILWAFAAAGAVTLPGVHFPELGFWFIALAAITWSGAAVAFFESRALFAVLSTLAAGATVAGIGYMNGTLGVERAGGWLFAFAAFFAWYTATAMMLKGTLRHEVLPLGQRPAAHPLPGHATIDPIEYSNGMPGVRAGQ